MFIENQDRNTNQAPLGAALFGAERDARTVFVALISMPLLTELDSFRAPWL